MINSNLSFNEKFSRDLAVTIELTHISLDLMVLVAMHKLALLEPSEVKSQAIALANRYIDLEMNASVRVTVDNPFFMPNINSTANPTENLLIHYYCIGYINQFNENSRCYHDDVIAENNLKRLSQYCQIQQKYAIK